MVCEHFLARATLARAGVRTYATVQDTPVRHYGGLKDQDRIFTNLYLRHDHGIKGAMVRSHSVQLLSRIHLTSVGSR